MSGKFSKIIVTLSIILIALFTLSARGLERPLTQMDMPTETITPASAGGTTTPVMPETPTPQATVEVLTAAGPTMTSIFTGFTPYPDTISGYYGPMGGSEALGSCPGMSGGGMGSGGMGVSGGYITGTLPMGGMGSGGMSMDDCPMMSGSMGMSGMNMSEIDMAAMNMAGTNMTGMTGSITSTSTSIFDRPWVLIGWIVLSLLVMAILVAAGFGIAWIIRRSTRIETT